MNREPNGRTCAHCGVALFGDQKRFCSTICKSRYWNGYYKSNRPEQRKCINCGKELPAGHRKFCSKRCNSHYYGCKNPKKKRVVMRKNDTRYPGTMAEIVEITRDNPNYGRLVKEVLNA